MGSDFESTIKEEKKKFGLYEKIPCDPELCKKYDELIKNGDKLPDGVEMDLVPDGSTYNHFFYTLSERTDLDSIEKLERIILMENKHVEKIEKYILFFVVLEIIAILIGVIYGIKIGSMFG